MEVRRAVPVKNALQQSDSVNVSGGPREALMPTASELEQPTTESSMVP